MYAQPQRARAGRQQSLALTAAQRGRPAFMRHPMDARRQAMRRKRYRKPRARYKTPLHRILGVRRNTSAGRR
jgi:hypothetical protein